MLDEHTSSGLHIRPVNQKPGLQQKTLRCLLLAAYHIAKQWMVTVVVTAIIDQEFHVT